MIINHTNIPDKDIKNIIYLMKEKIRNKAIIMINNTEYQITKILGIIIVK